MRQWGHEDVDSIEKMDRDLRLIDSKSRTARLN